jgi:hypothetical protein
MKITDETQVFNTRLLEAECPGCKKTMRFEKPGYLKVNIESEGKIPLKNWFTITSTCKNPLCEWSKIQ